MEEFAELFIKERDNMPVNKETQALKKKKLLTAPEAAMIKDCDTTSIYFAIKKNLFDIKMVLQETRKAEQQMIVNNQKFQDYEAKLTRSRAFESFNKPINRDK